MKNMKNKNKLLKKMYIIKTKKYDVDRKKNKYKFIIILALIILLLIFIFIRRFIFIKNNLIIKNNSDEKTITQRLNNTYKGKKIVIRKDLNEEYKDIIDFLYKWMNHTLYEPNKIFYKSDDPKISIVISTMNAERFINDTLFSIQNQDFDDVEIVIVDDGSDDNTINIINEIMKIDPRIVLLQNGENRGTTYTKTKGILNTKGKYVMILDQDDMYTQKDAFSTLYFYAEKNNLEILGFSGIFSDKIPFPKPKYIHFYIEYPIIYPPRIKDQMYKVYDNGFVERVGWYLWNFFIRGDLYKKTINQIDPKFLNVKTVCHEDFIIFFLLTRNAKNYKQIKRAFYNQMHLQSKSKVSNKTSISTYTKIRYNKNLTCSTVINYIEFLLKYTNDDYKDKNIASFELNHNFLSSQCRNNLFVREKGINLCKLFLDNKFIGNNVKKSIKQFLGEININYI